MKNKVKVPKFKSEDQERSFWAKVDLSEHFEKSDFQSAFFPNLKPSSKPISIRLPEYLLVRLKERANKLDVPYQSLIKEYVARELSERR